MKSEKKARKFNSEAIDSWLNKKVVPVLQVISANKFLRSLMSGFYTALPIIIFSSIIGIIMWVPPALAGKPNMYGMPVEQALNRIFSFTMGMVAMFFCAGISRTMAEKLNQQLPIGRKLNTTMVMFGAIISLFMLSVTGTFALGDDGQETPNFANLLVANLGAQGMLTGILVGLSVPWLFYLPTRYGWTIKLPKAVPQGVSQAFTDIIPLAVAVLFYWGVGYIFLATMNITFTDALFAAIQPIFSGLDSYGFLVAVAFTTATIWFIGVHGPSVTRPFLTAFMYTNLANNQALYAQGKQATWALTYEFSYDFSSTLGGTGATFVVPTLLIIFARSKQLKAVGFASYIPIWFQVNEPALFGCPLILNPIVYPAFIIAPILNVIVYKMFIVHFGMNGAIVDVPWSIPAIMGLLLGTGFQVQAFILWSVMVLIDLVVWLPFLLIYDRVVCKQEIEAAQEKQIPIPFHYSYFTVLHFFFGKHMAFSANKRSAYKTQLTDINAEISEQRAINKKAHAEEKLRIKEEEKERKTLKKEAKKYKKLHKGEEEVVQEDTGPVKARDLYHVLVICYGAGTSAMYANSLNKGAQKNGYTNVKAISSSYGNHKELLKDMDLVILSPQTKVYRKEIDNDMKGLRAKTIFTTANEYVSGTNDPQFAINLMLKHFPIEKPNQNKKAEKKSE